MKPSVERQRSARAADAGPRSAVARRVHGRLRVGAVYDPTRDEMFSASLTEEAYLNGRTITVIAAVTREGHRPDSLPC